MGRRTNRRELWFPLFTRRLQEELIISRDPWARPTIVCLSVVGIQSLRWGFRHQQRQVRHVPRSSGLEGAASGRSCGSHHRGIPDVLGVRDDG